MGAIELTAPTRVSKVNGGLRRLGISRHGFSFFLLHATLNLAHSRDWSREVIGPLIA